jgi:D-glycero-D-manno-heptose 1,7-bisphosphate phosphatase
VINGRPAVFFDRDGTLIDDVGFLKDPAALRMIPGAAEAVRTLNALNIPTCVVSNQSGVARGYIEESDLTAIHARLQDELRRAGAWLDRIEYCPHHPTAGIPPYNIVCECRKPLPGMLHRAASALQLDLRRSYVIGDKTIDVQTGKAVGAAAILVLTGFGKDSQDECEALGLRPDYVAPTVAEAVRFIVTKIGEQNSHA